MIESNVRENQVRLYALGDPSLFADEHDAIERAVLGALKVAPSDRHRVDISPSSGWMSYSAHGELWDRPTAPALPTKEVALKTAEDLLIALEQACSDASSKWPDALRGMSLFPPVSLLRRAGIHAVARVNGSAWDHWLYRAQPRLLLDEGAKTRIGVFGSQVEIRIGHGGRPITIRSRWRPLSGERELTQLSPFHPPGPEGKGDSHADAEPFLNFVLEGDGVPQYYLAPYYCRSEHSGVEMVSASPFSLTVEMARTAQGASRMTVSAFARGGSGDYMYNWGVYSPVRVEEGIRELGSGTVRTLDSASGKVVSTSIEIDNGHWIVMLNVKDRATGAFKHEQRQMFSGPLGSGRVK